MLANSNDQLMATAADRQDPFYSLGFSVLICAVQACHTETQQHWQQFTAVRCLLASGMACTPGPAASETEERCKQ